MAYSAGMQKSSCRALGIDTSCYTTSIAVVEGQNCLLDLRIPIQVPKGDIGLRQSDILFQHTQNLTQLMESIKGSFSLESISAVGYSASPRSQENSYMPVFLAGRSIATAVSTALACPLLSFSHQDGHMAAIQEGSPLLDQFMAIHLSGGTTEVVRASRNASFGYDVSLIGGTLDISFGQLIDRIGVYTGLPFPSGAAMDQAAKASFIQKDMIPLRPQIKSGWFNLSGYENKIKNLLSSKQITEQDLYKSLFMGIGKTLVDLIAACSIDDELILIAGGVSASQEVRRVLRETGYTQKSRVRFGSPELSTDNAVGIALLTAEAFIKGGNSHGDSDH